MPAGAGLFGKPLFNPPFDRHFGGLGLTVGGIGLILSAVILVLGVHGWAMDRLWIYLVGSALMMLVGLQMFISWLLMQKLEELSERKLRAGGYARGSGLTEAPVSIRISGMRS